MSERDSPRYWVGDKPTTDILENAIYVSNINDIPSQLGGILCINLSNHQEIDASLRAFFRQPDRWSWCVYVTTETDYSQCVTDGLFDHATALETWSSIQPRLEAILSQGSIDPLIGWLGIHRRRRVFAFKSLESTSIYSYPIIEALFPDLYSTYRYVLSEQNHGVLEAEQLIDRIRVCPHCSSGHLNYIEVCPDCRSIDIDLQSSLHCFTCGHVGAQQSFQRRGKLECPKCFTQLRHIGVDYDRPLENHVCNHCTSLFVEAGTIAQCLSCSAKIKIEELAVRKYHQFKLGENGEYIYQHGKTIQAPELSIKGKVEIGFFQNLLAWLNKVALRHHEHHTLLALHLPSLDAYGKQHGDASLFSLMAQLTGRLSSLFRDTDICCQYKQDVLLVLMPNTPYSNVDVLQRKLLALSELIEDEDFELNVFSWGLPNAAIDDGISPWLDGLMEHIYAAR